MNSLNRMQPYKPRAFCFDELRVLHKYDIKLYGLARRDEFPRIELLAGGKRFPRRVTTGFYFHYLPFRALSPFARGRAIVLTKRGSGTSTAALTALIDSVAVAEKN